LRTKSRRSGWRLTARIDAPQGDARAAVFRRFLEAWEGAPDPLAFSGDTWSRLLAGRPQRWPPMDESTARRLAEFLRSVPGLIVEVQPGKGD